MSVFWGGAAAPPIKPLIKDVLAVTMAVFWGGSGGAAAPPGVQGRREEDGGGRRREEEGGGNAHAETISAHREGP